MLVCPARMFLDSEERAEAEVTLRDFDGGIFALLVLTSSPIVWRQLNAVAGRHDCG